jgi:4-hydroxybenzoate polyprenyltransferase
VQASAAIMLDARLLVVLGAVWAYMGLMRVEFFASAWLRSRPLAVLWTHMLVMPLIDLYITATDWVPADAHVVAGLRWFLIASFFNGMVVEIGRKIRVPTDEEHGVDTYSSMWGRGRALIAWMVVMLASLVCAGFAARVVGAERWVAAILAMLWSIALSAGIRVNRSSESGAGRRVEVLAGVWTLAVYLTLGLSPWLVRHG